MFRVHAVFLVMFTSILTLGDRHGLDYAILEQIIFWYHMCFIYLGNRDT